MMIRIALLSALFVPVLLVAACEPLSPPETAPVRIASCQATDWFTFGRRDGELGVPMHDRDRLFADCASLGHPADLVAYRAGHSEGLFNYCTAAKGYAVGIRDDAYHGVCPPGLEPEFLDGYERGLAARPRATPAPDTDWWPFIFHDEDQDRHHRRDRDDDGRKRDWRKHQDHDRDAGRRHRERDMDDDDGTDGDRWRDRGDHDRGDHDRGDKDWGDDGKSVWDRDDDRDQGGWDRDDDKDDRGGWDRDDDKDDRSGWDQDDDDDRGYWDRDDSDHDSGGSDDRDDDSEIYHSGSKS